MVLLIHGSVPAPVVVRVATRPYPLSRADAALADLAADRVNGAAVLVPDPVSGPAP